MIGQADHLASQQIERPTLTSVGRPEARDCHKQCRFLTRQFAHRTRARALMQRLIKAAFHNVPLGPPDCWLTNRNGTGDVIVAGAVMGREQNLRPLDCPCRVLAA
jgi:hypothetical protein